MKGLQAVLLLILLAVSPALAQTVYQVADAAMGEDGVQRLELVADNYFYRPNYLVVKAGTPVEMKIRRESRLVPHDFVLSIPEAGIDIREPISTAGTLIRFTPTVPGKFSFSCSERLLFFASHQDKGMEGVLEVRP